MVRRRTAGSSEVDVRVLADWVAELGRARPRRQARAGDDLAASSRRCARCCASRSAPSACRTPARAAAPAAAARRAEAAPRSRRSLDALDGDGPLRELRNRALVELVYSAGLRSAEAVGLDLGDVDFEQELVHVRHGKGAKDRVVPLGEEAAHWSRATCARRGPQLARGAEQRAVPLGARPAARHLDAAPARAAPAPPAPRVRDAPARGRRRPAHDPGAARPRVALDDADVQPRRREAPAPGLRPRPSAILTVELEGFLALLAARRARRGQSTRTAATSTALGAFLGKPRREREASTTSSATSRSSAPTASPATTIARRTAAARSFFRHLQLLGARADNPAAALTLPRRAAPLPKTLSAGEAERLIDAASGTTPRALRDRALVELLYGAGLRVSEAVGLEQERRRPRRPPRARGRQGRQGARRPDRPPGRRGAAPLPRRAAARTSTRRHRPELFLNAQGGRAHPRRRVPHPAPPRRQRPGSTRRACIRICCATRSRRTCSRAEPTSAASRRCSATPTSRRPSCTPTSPTRRREMYYRAHPHARRERRRSTVIDPHVERSSHWRRSGVPDDEAGSKNRLSWAPSFTCPSCGRSRRLQLPPLARLLRRRLRHLGRSSRARAVLVVVAERGRGSGSCRGRGEPFFSATTASRRTASLPSCATSSCSSGRTSLTSPGVVAREPLEREQRRAAAPPGSRRRARDAGAPSSVRKRNWPIARNATARSRKSADAGRRLELLVPLRAQLRRAPARPRLRERVGLGRRVRERRSERSTGGGPPARRSAPTDGSDGRCASARGCAPTSRRRASRRTSAGASGGGISATSSTTAA